MSFQQALSGLNGASKGLEVIGNNISNSATIGFKMSRTEFADVYAASLNGAGGNATGIGVEVAAVTQQFTQGNITATDNPMDLAINGDGFFQVGDGFSPPSYTRNGQFKVLQGRGEDSDKKFIADNNGLYLLGIPAGQTTPGRLSLPTGRIPAQQTTEITLEANLPSDRPALSDVDRPIATVDDLGRTGDAKTIDFTTSQSLFDGKGQKVDLTYHFRKLAEDPVDGPTGRDSWAIYITANGRPVPAADPLQPAIIARFDRSNGRNPDFVDPANGNAVSNLLPQFSVPQIFDETKGLTTEAIGDITINLRGLTQFGGQFGVTKLTQDGFPSGELQDFAIESNGQITARYSNGQSEPAGQVQIVRFINPQGLRPMGGNLWASTVDSGAPTANNPGQGGAGDLMQGSLEESNVDLTAQLVNMITAQRAYQANAQTIKTMDQVLQTVVNLR